MGIKLKFETNETRWSPVKSLEMELLEGATWPDLAQEFLNFLRGCGYSIPSQVISEEEEVDYLQKQEE